MFGLVPEDSIRMRCGLWSQWKWQLADTEVAQVCSSGRGLGWEPGEVSSGSGYSENAMPLGRVFNLPDPQFPPAENESSWPLYLGFLNSEILSLQLNTDQLGAHCYYFQSLLPLLTEGTGIAIWSHLLGMLQPLSVDSVGPLTGFIKWFGWSCGRKTQYISLRQF